MHKRKTGMKACSRVAHVSAITIRKAVLFFWLIITVILVSSYLPFCERVWLPSLLVLTSTWFCMAYNSTKDACSWKEANEETWHVHKFASYSHSFFGDSWSSRTSSSVLRKKRKMRKRTDCKIQQKEAKKSLPSCLLYIKDESSFFSVSCRVDAKKGLLDTRQDKHFCYYDEKYV